MTVAESPAQLVQEGDEGMRLEGVVSGDNAVALRRDGESFLARVSGGACDIDLSGVESASSILLSLMLCWKRFADDHALKLSYTGSSERLIDLAFMSHVSEYLSLSGGNAEH